MIVTLLFLILKVINVRKHLILESNLYITEEKSCIG